MRLNNRGIFGVDDIIALAIVGIVFFSAGMFGPKLIDSAANAFHGGSKNRQTSIIKESGSRPLVYKDEATGEIINAGVEKYQRYSNEAVAEQPKLSFLEKLQSIGAWFIALLIISIVAVPGFGLWLWKRLQSLKQSLQDMTKKHDTLEVQAMDILQALDNGIDAYNGRVAAYQKLADDTTDSSIKIKYSEIVNILNSAMKTLDDKMYAEMDNDSYVVLAKLRAAPPGVKI